MKEHRLIFITPAEFRKKFGSDPVKASTVKRAFTQPKTRKKSPNRVVKAPAAPTRTEDTLARKTDLDLDFSNSRVATEKEARRIGGRPVAQGILTEEETTTVVPPRSTETGPFTMERRKEIVDAGFFINNTTGAVTDEFGNPVDPNTLKPIQGEAKPVFGSEEDEAKALLSGQIRQGAEFEEELFGEAVSPSSLEEVLTDFQKDQEQQKADFERSQGRQERILDLQAEQANIAGESQVAGVEASLAQGREGPVSTATAGTKEVFIQGIDNQFRQASTRRDVARDSLRVAEQDLIKAQKQGKAKLAATLREDIALAKQEIRKAEAAVLDSQAALLAEERAGLKERNVATETTITTLEAMGSAAGNLTPDQLEQMIEGTSLTLAQATALQQASVLRGKASETKDEAEAAKLVAQAEKIEKETLLAGKAPGQAEFEFFNELSTADQDAFMELKRAKPGLQIVKSGDDIFSFDPATNTVTPLVSSGTDTPGAGITVGDFGNTANLPAPYVETTSALGAGHANNYGHTGWPHGLDWDLAGGSGSELNSPMSGTVVEALPNTNALEGWGGTVKVDIGGGKFIRFSHLSSLNVKEGDVITEGMLLGTQGGGEGDPGRGKSTGSHIDITMYKPDGGYYTAKEVASYLGVGQQPALDTSTAGGQLKSGFIQQAEELGLTGKEKDEFVTDRINDSFKPMTEAQSSAFNAYTLALPEHELYNTLVAKADPEEFADGINIISKKITNPDEAMTSELINRLANEVEDVDVRRALLAEMTWVQAVLRKESGAAISIGEYLSKGRAFFPRAGDDPQTMKDLENRRSNQMTGLFGQMGPSGQRSFLETQLNKPLTDEQVEAQNQSYTDFYVSGLKDEQLGISENEVADIYNQAINQPQ